ncbi:hypothetical protein DBQ04_06845 [Lactobacillus acidophilus]|uniref:Uncharacterized protein n=1 Tax=Lactobacillus acidophilus (strain ATCC 700396 / NCK56 / N2 / NCFM) TaxID=272621 RepID=Q5FI21_LACAC|nr:hypothetical protein LBA1851 [Lactobacillus acidophilus NCFM]AZN77401.1 hypothetical protein CXB72_09850 [Lactobacillus acidophilus]KAB1964912.1 hypothetical protein F8247_07510 [Lactobacillus acidophilus]MBO8212426.1 hypothetical protein [Lactobacillus acidophilus]MCT3594247.1 hypothetical protein [Lactobacillus acidophilus]
MLNKIILNKDKYFNPVLDEGESSSSTFILPK